MYLYHVLVAIFGWRGTPHQVEIMKYFTLLFLPFVFGCAMFESVQKERQLLFEPKQLPSNTQIFERMYSDALKAVDKNNATPAEIVAYVDAGNALQIKYCTDWFDRLKLKSRGLIASDHNMAVAGGLLTTIAGAFNWPANAVMALGAGQVALQGFSQNIQTDVVGAPSQFAVQNKIFELQAECGNKLLAEAKTLKFSQAYLGLERCARVCSHDAASDAVTRALMVVK
jgi:hypothetical protein